MFRVIQLVLWLCNISVGLIADDLQFEGVVQQMDEPLFKNLMERFVVGYLPYNPVIIETRGYRGEGSSVLATIYPKGRIFVFEPNSQDFQQLSINMQFFENVEIYNLELNEKYITRAPCANLDSWCTSNHINQVDLIRLDVNGSELNILKSSPVVLKTVSLIIAKTDLRPSNKNGRGFIDLKYYLEMVGFKLLTHCYKKNSEGEAIFLRNDIYHAIYG